MRRALAIATAVLAGATLVAQGASAVSIDAATRTCLRTTYGVGATRAIVAAKTLTAQQRARVQRCKAAVATTTTAAPATTTTAATTTTTTTTTTVAADRTAPVLTLTREKGTSSSSTIVFYVTGNEAINCTTISTTNGVDFTFKKISRIDTIAQSKTTECTITAQSTSERNGITYDSTLTAAATFSVADTAGNAATTISPTSITTNVTRT
jgi:hypothetical protein